MKRYLIALGVFAYALAGVATFGHTFNRMTCEFEISCTDFKVAGSLLAGMVWPLTVSVLLQERAADANS